MDLSENVKVNFVTKMIDYYNKYQGLAVFLVCVVTTLFRQKELALVLSGFEDVDHVFKKNFEGYKITCIAR